MKKKKSILGLCAHLILGVILFLVVFMIGLNMWSASADMSNAVVEIAKWKLVPQNYKDAYALEYCKSIGMELVQRMQTRGLYGNLEEIKYCANSINESFVYWNLTHLCLINNAWVEEWCKDENKKNIK